MIGGVGLLLAHAFGKRYDLPVPLGLYVTGGALAVLVSAAVVIRRPAAARSAPTTSTAAPATVAVGAVPARAAVPVTAVPATAVPAATVPAAHAPAREGAAATLAADAPERHEPDGDPADVGAGWRSGLAVAVLGLLVLGGLDGSQVVAENLLPVGFWLVVWIAVPISCAAIGDWTRPVNAFAALSRWADRPGLRERLLGDPDPLPWPSAVGWWPAAALLFAAGCGELVFNLTATVPRVLATGLSCYGACCVAGGLLWGPAWRQRGEMFSVLFATWGRLGWWRFGAAGRRGAAGGLDRPFAPVPSRVVVVLLLLVTVNFDGLLATPAWGAWEGPIRHPGLEVAVFAGLVGATAVVFGAFAAWSARVAGNGDGPLAATSGLLPSLVPIAFGYLLAHNAQYLVINLQLLFPLLGNPAGLTGWPVLPSPFNDSYEPALHLLPPGAYWYLAVVAIVAGHIAAVVLAHRHLDQRTADLRRARRSELPWLAAMVGYTMLSLWLVAQPLAR